MRSHRLIQLARGSARRHLAIERWTVGPAVLPTLSDEAIAHNLTAANAHLMQVSALSCMSTGPPGIIHALAHTRRAALVAPAPAPRSFGVCVLSSLAAARQYSQVCTAHLTHEEAWLHEDDDAKLRAKLAEVMAAYRDSGRAAAAPDCSPIFKDMCEVLRDPRGEGGGWGRGRI